MNSTIGSPQGTNRRNARWAGVFYIIATVAPILTFPFIGFLGGGVAGEPLPDYLVTISENLCPCGYWHYSDAISNLEKA